MQNNGSLFRDGQLSEISEMDGITAGFINTVSVSLLSFPGLYGSERNIKDLAIQNGENMFKVAFNIQEKAFIDRFVTQDFYLTHSTGSRLDNENGDVNIFSRALLKKRKISFNEENSTVYDINGLGNDDYVFFSLEIGETPRKMQKSRFGNTIYKAPISIDTFRYLSLSLIDQLEMQYPTPKIKGLSHEGVKELSDRPTLKRAQVFFHGRDASIASLARHIAFVTRYLSNPSDIDTILNASTPEILDSIMNTIFRPEVRVPRLARLKKGNFYTFNL
jgi:insecticidal toxin complex protein TccC